MKTLNYLFIPVFIFAVSQNLLAADLNSTAPDCEIGAIYVEIEPCDEAGNFDVILSFEYANVGIEGFRVQGNGNNYGNFEYESLPITIGPLEGDGVTEYEFVVIDNEFEDCTNWTAIDPVDCNTGGECMIFDLVVDDHPCDGEHFNVYLNFEYENVSNEGFTLYVNDDLFESYSYEDLPLESIGPFDGDGTTVYIFEVYDQVFENCFDINEFGPIDCGGGGDCNIWDVEATVLPCDENGFFMVLINFEYENVSEIGFSLLGNGNDYGDFLYENLPVEIGPLEGDGITAYEFLAEDNHYDDCSDWTEIDPVNCETAPQMTNLETDVTACLDNLYQLTISFDFENEGEDGFIVTGNNKEYGEFQYDELPVIISQLWTDGITPYYFIVKDKANITYGNWNQLIPFTCENLGISDEAEEEILVYPNPFIDAVSIRYQISDVRYLICDLYSISGIRIERLIETKEIVGENEIEIELNHLPAGIYFVRLQIGESVLVKKLVKVE